MIPLYTVLYIAGVLFTCVAVGITARKRQDFPTLWSRRAVVVAMILCPVLNVVYGGVIMRWCQNSSCPIAPRRKGVRA